MSEHRFTPGPREIHKRHLPPEGWLEAYGVTDCAGSLIALFRTQADARLDHAAPDLAAACEAAVTRVHTGEGHVRDLSECRDGACKLLFAALQKAGLR